MKRVTANQLLTIVLLITGLSANATPVTWVASGRVDQLTYSPTDSPFPLANVGDLFQVTVRFDSNAALIGTDTGDRFEPGTRYRYNGDSVVLSARVGESAVVVFDAHDLSFGVLDVLDDTSYIAGVPWDGYRIGRFDPASLANAVLLVRGPILDVVHGPGLPTIPDPRLAMLEQHFFSLNGTHYDS